MEYVERYFLTLWELTMEMAPWLLLGFLFSGILKVVFPQQVIHKWLGKPGFLTNVRSALFGVPLPLCSCGVIPAGVALNKGGASKGATNTFLISTPQTGVDSFFATYALMGWPFAIMRPFIAFVTGVIGGSVTDIFVKEKSIEVNPTQIQKKEKVINFNQKIKTVLHYGFIEMIADIAKWLVVGLLLATLISVLIPEDFFGTYLGNTFLEFGIILAISIPLYVCATGSIPIAMVLLMKGISPGAAILFLMAGPATNIATMTVIGKTMGKKSLIAYLGSIIGGALIFSLLINFLIPKDWLLASIPSLNTEMHSSIFPLWLSVGFAIILIGLIGYSFYSMYFGNSHNHELKTNKMKTINVTGMTCNHCKANVERNLSALDGIETVVADIHNNKVSFDGNVDTNIVKEKINSLGYTVE